MWLAIDEESKKANKGRGGVQAVSVLAFYSDNPSLNLDVAYIFSVTFVFEKNENKQKSPALAHLRKQHIFSNKLYTYLVSRRRASV